MKRNAIRRSGTALAAAIGIAAAGAASAIVAPSAQAATYYGAIAYSGNGSYGTAQDYPTRATAESTAVIWCGYTDCSVLASFSQCGAVATDGRQLYGGTGPTLAAAQSKALSNLGGGWIDSWICN